LFDPFAGKILVRSYPVNAGKEPVKMITGEAGLPGQAIQIDRRVEIAVDIELGRYDLFIYVWGYGH
jgi:hypothetical protein